MVSCGTEAVNLTVQSVRHPGQRMPVGRIRSSQSPDDRGTAQTRLHKLVCGYVLRIVVVRKGMLNYRAIKRKDQNREQNADLSSPPLRNRTGSLRNCRGTTSNNYSAAAFFRGKLRHWLAALPSGVWRSHGEKLSNRSGKRRRRTCLVYRESKHATRISMTPPGMERVHGICIKSQPWSCGNREDNDRWNAPGNGAPAAWGTLALPSLRPCSVSSSWWERSFFTVP